MRELWWLIFLLLLSIQDDNAVVCSRSSGPLRARRSAWDPNVTLDDPSLLHLWEPPHVTTPRTRTVIYAKKDSPVPLTCIATGFPAPTYQWTFNGADTPKNYFLAYPNGSALIQKMGERERGYYQCSATNVHGTSLSEVLDVRPIVDNPFNVLATANLTGKVGQGISIPCFYKPFFDPPGTIDWYTQIRDKPNNDGSQVQIKKDSRIYVDVNGTLYITRLEAADDKADRFYVCAVNSVDQSTITLGSKMATLTVKPLQSGENQYSSPKLLSSTRYLEVDVGKEAIMECIFAANPDATLKWFDKTDRVIGNSSRTTITDFGRRLRIQSVTTEDEGSFRCHADNSLGGDGAFVFLNVTSPPMFVRNQSNVLAPRGGDATFVCDATEAPGEFPLPPPKWFINARSLETEVHPSEYTLSPDKKRVTFRGLTDNSTRGIQCNVTNQRGYAFWDGYLKVIEPMTIKFKPNRTVAIKTGQPVELSVVATSDPCCPHQFAWQLNGTNLTETQLQQPPFSYSVYGESARLRIDANTTDDVLKALGTYRCIVYHHVYEDPLMVDVIVHLEHVSPEAEPVQQAAFNLWWLGIVFGILVLIIVGVVIFLMVHYNFPRQAYFLEKEELKHRLDPKKDILDQSFTEI
ncbi:neuroglian-like [Pomacea canaliculata]|uniref:neuroglian-like n=1 Tax=Pomacea canaliculata TaxID=400727 RepID=UPI000D725BB3|nr:neuroglian-like [Pomacea canaliculata]